MSTSKPAVWVIHKIQSNGLTVAVAVSATKREALLACGKTTTRDTPQGVLSWEANSSLRSMFGFVDGARVWFVTPVEVV